MFSNIIVRLGVTQKFTLSEKSGLYAGVNFGLVSGTKIQGSESSTYSYADRIPGTDQEIAYNLGLPILNRGLNYSSGINVGYEYAVLENFKLNLTASYNHHFLNQFEIEGEYRITGYSTPKENIQLSSNGSHLDFNLGVIYILSSKVK